MTLFIVIDCYPCHDRVNDDILSSDPAPSHNFVPENLNPNANIQAEDDQPSKLR
jgi:hypothetical protein